MIRFDSLARPMISIREIDYDTNEDSEKVFSRLTWAVEKVDGLAGQLITNRTVDTNRPWVGVYDKEKMNFGLIEPRGFFRTTFFQIVVRGQITTRENKTFVNVKLRLGWNTFLTFAMLYVMAAVMIGLTIVNGEIEDIGGLLIWLLIFPVLGTILLSRKLNRMEKKVEDLFGFQ
jgi:hypothetical protein